MRVGRHLTEEEILEENRWVEAARKDISMFSKLYDRYFEAIFGYIYRRTDDEQLADDICSQTFLKAMQNLGKYQFRGLPFSAWLFRIATNEVNRHYRKSGGGNIFSIEEERLRNLVDEAGGTDWIEENLPLMVEALRDAPTDVVEVLELRFFEEKSFREIAFILDITESGAKMRTYRALGKIRRSIEKTGNRL